MHTLKYVYQHMCVHACVLHVVTLLDKFQDFRISTRQLQNIFCLTSWDLISSTFLLTNGWYNCVIIGSGSDSFIRWKFETDVQNRTVNHGKHFVFLWKVANDEYIIHHHYKKDNHIVPNIQFSHNTIDNVLLYAHLHGRELLTCQYLQSECQTRPRGKYLADKWFHIYAGWPISI